MPKQELLIQLITEGRPAWQVRVEVSKKLCRKMTDRELEQVGNTMVSELAAIIQDSEVPEKEKKGAAPETHKKKGG